MNDNKSIFGEIFEKIERYISLIKILTLAEILMVISCTCAVFETLLINMGLPQYVTLGQGIDIPLAIILIYSVIFIHFGDFITFFREKNDLNGAFKLINRKYALKLILFTVLFFLSPFVAILLYPLLGNIAIILHLIIALIIFLVGVLYLFNTFKGLFLVLVVSIGTLISIIMETVSNLAIIMFMIILIYLSYSSGIFSNTPNSVNILFSFMGVLALFWGLGGIHKKYIENKKKNLFEKIKKLKYDAVILNLFDIVLEKTEYDLKSDELYGLFFSKELFESEKIKKLIKDLDKDEKFKKELKQIYVEIGNIIFFKHDPKNLDIYENKRLNKESVDILDKSGLILLKNYFIFILCLDFRNIVVYEHEYLKFKRKMVEILKNK